MIPATEPLRPYALRSAVAAYLNVPREAIKLAHEIGPTQKAIGRAIRAYMKDAASNLESPRVPPGVMRAGEVVAHVPASPLPAEFHGKQPEAEAA